MTTQPVARPPSARLVVSGTLLLTSPAHLGGGESDGSVDMVIIRDASEGRPLLAGASIAGALRSYLRAWQQGHRESEFGGRLALAEALFGGTPADPEGEQSPLIVDDAFGADAPLEVRDGVALDSATRTAEDKKKYNVEILPQGTAFELRFELLLPGDAAYAAFLRDALALALRGLERGEIPIGARKTRGFGRCAVPSWTVSSYDLRTTDGALAWLAADHPEWLASSWATAEGDAASALGAEFPPRHPRTGQALVDQRKTFALRATCRLASPLLLRAAAGESEGVLQPDAAQLHTRWDGKVSPVLSGSSLAGALRGRALRIAQTVAADSRSTRPRQLVENLFGPSAGGDEAAELFASRLIAEEHPISDARSIIQARVGIDRFTGGAYETALFTEAPVVEGGVVVQLAIHDPQDAEVGLLLLLLKDLWTGDLPLGGTISVGRGRLRGMAASLRGPGSLGWELTASDDGAVTVASDTSDAAQLEAYVGALSGYLEASQ